MDNEKGIKVIKTATIELLDVATGDLVVHQEEDVRSSFQIIKNPVRKSKPGDPPVEERPSRGGPE